MSDYQMAGEIVGTSVARLVEVLADPEWEVSDRGDELELRGTTLSMAVYGGRRAGDGTTFLVSARLKRVDLAQAKALLERIGARLAAHGILYSFELEDPDQDDTVMFEHPGYAQP